MKRFSNKIVLFIALLLVLTPITGNAQSNNKEERITLSPAISRPELDAGESARGKLTVINDGSTAYTFVLYARPFSVDNESYDPNYTTVNEQTKAFQWVQFDKTSLKLAAGERVEIGYTVTVPEKAAGGGHYAVLFAETQPPKDGASVSRKKRVGSLLYMTVSGDVIKEGSIASWEAPFIQSNKPLTSTLRLKNTGNVHYQADALVSYSNIFGKKRFELKQETLVLPGTTRRVSVDWQTVPYFGIFKANGTVSYLGKTEKLSSKWIVFFPKSLAYTVGIVLILLILIFANGKRRKKKRSKTKADEKK